MDGDTAEANSWPWQCLTCDAAIFHDAEHCSRCAPSRTRATLHRRSPDGFVRWIRRETLPSLTLKVSAIAVIELSLTALWLQLLLHWPDALAAGLS
ncbi:hypothetical protein [Halovivax gelatinilyticus]|uniref:hypothetical protein n=1 Tax=Halovivax gelatinilyticus TaxID=2961597 RepID=UPI0020CA5C10|nr:hypothetical protein [Halovivax gelatinilyticus]